jgi:hypothetical protein
MLVIFPVFLNGKHIKTYIQMKYYLYQVHIHTKLVAYPK